MLMTNRTSGADLAAEEKPASLRRAGLRIDWAVKALVAAAGDLEAVGARGACEVVGDEADRLGQLASEVRALHAPAKP